MFLCLYGFDRRGIKRLRSPRLNFGNRRLPPVAAMSDFFEINGQRFSHIIDPRTARAAGHSISVSVIAPTATAADAVATALNVMTIEDALQWCESHDEYDCLIVDSLGKQYRSDGWPTKKKS